MPNNDYATTTLINVSGSRYRVQRAEVNKDELITAFDRVKADTSKLETAIANPDLVINQAVVKQILIYLLALGRLVIALSLKVNKLERQ